MNVFYNFQPTIFLNNYSAILFVHVLNLLHAKRNGSNIFSNVQQLLETLDFIRSKRPPLTENPRSSQDPAP